MSLTSQTKVFDSKIHDSFIVFFLKSLSDLKIYRYALYNFVANSLRTRYRRSALGFLWSLLNPLLIMSVVSVVFSIVYHQNIRNFSIYVFSGLAPWGFINASLQAGSMSLINGEGFLKKVYLPKLFFPLSVVSTEAVNFMFSLISVYLLALILGATLTWQAVLLPFAIFIIYLFALGMALIMSVLTVYFRDLTQIISVVLTALFYTVPIIYPYEQIPENLRWAFQINPFFYFIQLFRKTIYYSSEASTLIDWFIPLGIALLTLALGMLLLMKKDRDIIYRL